MVLLSCLLTIQTTGDWLRFGLVSLLLICYGGATIWKVRRARKDPLGSGRHIVRGWLTPRTPVWCDPIIIFVAAWIAVEFCAAAWQVGTNGSTEWTFSLRRFLLALGASVVVSYAYLKSLKRFQHPGK